MPVEELESKDYKINSFVLGAFSTNCYVLTAKASRQTAIIDLAAEPEPLLSYLKAEALDPGYILITHAHIDHVHSIKRLKDIYPEAQLAIHSDDDPLVAHIDEQCSLFGFSPIKIPNKDVDLKKIATIALGELQIYALHTPGHSPGHVCFYLPSQRILFSGDLLFKNSIGRSDFEGGDPVIIKQSLKMLCHSIPDDVRIFPGHGAFSTMGSEKAQNPFL